MPLLKSKNMAINFLALLQKVDSNEILKSMIKFYLGEESSDDENSSSSFILH